jgi:hypothetical protein
VKNPNPHEGYAPDLFSEHALAAQLGLYVLDLLRRAEKAQPGRLEWSDEPIERRAFTKARELGLLEKDAH